MYETVKFLHLFSLMLGGAAAFGSIVVARQIRQTDAANMPILGPLRPIFGRLGLIGGLLLWLTGLIMFISAWADVSLGWVFHAKMLFASILLVASLVANVLAQRAARAGTPPPVQVIAPLGMLASVSAVIAIGLAVIVFN